MTYVSRCRLKFWRGLLTFSRLGQNLEFLEVQRNYRFWVQVWRILVLRISESDFRGTIFVLDFRIVAKRLSEVIGNFLTREHKMGQMGHASILMGQICPKSARNLISPLI